MPTFYVLCTESDHRLWLILYQWICRFYWLQSSLNSQYKFQSSVDRASLTGYRYKSIHNIELHNFVNFSAVCLFEILIYVPLVTMAYWSEDPSHTILNYLLQLVVLSVLRFNWRTDTLNYKWAEKLLVKWAAVDCMAGFLFVSKTGKVS
jgi:hypothetical protein